MRASVLIDALLAIRPDASPRSWADLARALGSGPLGDGNAKTGAPGTYRPVGATCPPACPFLGHGCYAQGGHVALVERRASPDPWAGIASAVACAVWARRTGRPAGRLHVSGDVGSTRAEVDAYLGGLVEAMGERASEWEGVLLWGYTRSPHALRWLARLAEVGIVLRRSGYLGRGGAVVATDLAGARAESRAPVARCPAQVSEKTCVECGLCWLRPDVAIAFLPEGTRVNEVRNIVSAHGAV